MKRIWTMLVVIAALSAARGETVNPSDYANAVRIRFDGYTQPTPLTNFPALLTFADGEKGFRYSDMESGDYSDLRFAASDGTSSIPYEVEAWNSTIPTATSPTNISGCTLWLKADEGVETNGTGNVTNWVDQSGNGHHATSATTGEAPRQVLSALNGLPVVRFDGADDRLTTSGSYGERTVILVLNNTDTPNFSNWEWPFGSLSPRHTSLFGSPGTANMGGTGTRYVNGVATDSFAPLPAYKVLMSQDSSTRTSSAWLIGDGDVNWSGDIAEVIVFDRALTPPEVAGLHLYLEAKYAIDVDVEAIGATTSHVWVQVPVLTNNAAIYAYWGNTNATALQTYTTNGATWDSGFEAVYHLAESGGNALDSTANDYSATALNGVGQGHRGKVGPACYFDGVNDYLSCDAGIFPAVPTRFSVEWWLFPKNRKSWNQQMQAAQGSWNYWMFHTDNNGRACAGTRNNASSRINVNGAMTDINTWRHFAFTFDNGLARFYKNGVLVGEKPNSNPSVGGWNGFLIGANGGNTINGMADEVRISNVGWSSNWVAACHANQANPGTFSRVELDSFWDTSTTAGLQAGDGVWSTTNANWSSSAFGSDPLKAWDNGAAATFTASGTSVVSVADVTAYGMIVDGSGYSFVGGSLTINRGGVAANKSLGIASAVSLAAAQEWAVATGETMTVSGTVDNGGNALTVLGEGDAELTGVVSGGGGLTKDGTGTLLIDAYDTYTGGTLVNAGTLQLNKGGEAGALRGSLTVEADAQVDLTAENALGWGGNRITTLNINGGVLNNAAAGDNGWGITITLDGGELRSNGGTADAGTPQLFSLGGGSTIRTVADANTAVVSGRINLREGNVGNSLPFDVGDSGTSTGLFVTAVITEQGAARGITKKGGGIMAVTADNVYSGGTTIENGTLMVNNTAGSGVGSGAVTINGGTLGGTGTVGASVSVGTSGFVSPGASVGALRIEGDLDLTSAGVAGLYVELNATNAYDVLTVTGLVTLGDALLGGEIGFTPGSNDTFFILVNEGPDAVNGTFSGIAQGGTVELDGATFNVSYEGNAATEALTGGNDVVLYNGEQTGGPGGEAPYWMQIAFAGYARPTPLTNFPALVFLSDELDDFSYATMVSATGADLRFFTETNEATRTELNYEIEEWDAGGTSFVWVQLPVLTNGTSIWACWGDTNLATAPAYTTNGATWDSEFVGVWHLGGSAGENLSDSSSNRLDLTQGDDPVDGVGVISTGEDFDGANDLLYISGSAVSDTGLDMNEATVSLWVKADSGAGAWDNVWEIGTNGTSEYVLETNGGRTPQLYVIGGRAGASAVDGSAAGDLRGAWKHVVATMSAADDMVALYVNGSLINSATWSATVPITEFSIGGARMRGTGRCMNMGGDEVRLSRAARSADWIWACYQNQSDPAAFMGIPQMVSYWDTSPALGIQAGDGTWDDGVTAAWSDDDVLGSSPLMTWHPALRDAYFTAGGTSDVTVDNATVNRVVIGAPGYTLSGGMLTLNAGIEANESATIASTADLVRDQGWVVASNKTVTCTGIISGGGRLTKTGSGTLNLRAHNPFTGGVTVDEGTLLVDIGGWGQIPGHGNGKLIVNRGALADFRGVHAFGSGGGGRDAHINGGTLYFQNENYVRAIEMTAGLIYGPGENRAAGGGQFIVYAADEPSVVSNRFNMVNAKTFNVADGTAADDLLVAGPITGNGAVTKVGAGVLNTTGANTYAGATTINAGTFLVNGSHSGTNAYTINGGTLGGTGTVAAAVSFGANGGSIAPGAMTGTLTVNSNVNFTTTGAKSFDVRVNGAADHSQLAVNGSVVLDGATLNLSVGDGVTGGETLFVIVNDDTVPVTGTFAGLGEGQTVIVAADGGGEIPFTIHYVGDSATGGTTGGNDVVLVTGAPGTLLIVR